MLKKAGFTSRSGKGSHTVWSHPSLNDSITILSKDGKDAERYHDQNQSMIDSLIDRFRSPHFFFNNFFT